MTEKRVRRKTFTDTTIANLQRRPKRYIVADPEQRGHYVRVMRQGAHVFVCVARSPFGRQIWATIGTTSDFSVDEAREKARAAIRRIRRGEAPFPAPKVAPDSVSSVCEAWLERVARKQGYRTVAEKERVIKKHIAPYFKGRAFVDIRRSDVTALLDHIEDKHGAFTADYTLSVLRTVATWVSKRDDGYTPPFVRGMARVSAQARARKRILDDAELRAVWAAADDAGAYGALVKLLLLTAQRRGAVLNMRWSSLLAGGVWNVPQEERAKGVGGELKLPEMALDIVCALPRLIGNDFVFIQRGMNLERLKFRLDEASGVSGFTLHDLRRTARSLMSRANVRPDIAERVLGHAIGGVACVYDRHAYASEKADALARLAALIASVIHPPVDNIVALHGAVS
jgi:integrase